MNLAISHVIVQVVVMEGVVEEDPEKVAAEVLEVVEALAEVTAATEVDLLVIIVANLDICRANAKNHEMEVVVDVIVEDVMTVVVVAAGVEVVAIIVADLDTSLANALALVMVGVVVEDEEEMAEDAK